MQRCLPSHIMELDGTSACGAQSAQKKKKNTFEKTQQQNLLTEIMT